MHFPDIFATSSAPVSPLQHYCNAVATIWGSVNLASYGATALTLIPPILIAATGFVAARNVRETNRINRERLEFDRQRYEDERRTLLHPPPVVVSPAASSPAPGSGD